MGTTNKKEYMEYIVRTYSDMLLNIAYTYLKNTADAENAVQVLYVKMIENNYTQLSFSDKENEKAWLIRTTINICLNVLSSAHRNKDVELKEEYAGTKEEDNYLFTEVMKLPQNYRTVIHMFYYEGYSIAEIAFYLKKKPATVGTWLSRAREMLRKQLGDDYLED